MLLRIVQFLLESFFFVFIGAFLLRAYMHRLRINMTQQPGLFVMALTDWLVLPLRRVAPKAWLTNIDTASLFAAALLALLWALIYFIGFSGFSDGLHATRWESLLGLPLLFLAIKMLLRVALQIMVALLVIYVIASWVQPYSPLFQLLERLTQPWLNFLRKHVPLIGGVDLSPLLLLVLLQIGLMVLA